MDKAHYTHGTPLKVAAARPGDCVWAHINPRTIHEKANLGANWYRLSFEDGSIITMSGNKTLDRAEKHMDLPSAADRQDLMVDLTTEVIILKAKVEARDLEAAEREEQHEHDNTRIAQLEVQVAGRDKTNAVLRKELDRLRAILETIDQAVLHARND